MNLRFPPHLRPGDRVDIVAPSSSFDRASFDEGLSVLRDLGLQPVLGEHVLARTGYLAGNDAQRARDLVHALTRTDTTAVFCARGGYGAMRLLPELFARPHLAEALGNKLLVGFSDVTALHAFCWRAGAVSLHGPVVTSLRRVGEASRVRLREVLFGSARPAPVSIPAPLRIRGGRASGPLVGGNLSVLTRLIGTRAWPDLRGAILFLEDVGERPYRLDRMLTHLQLADALRDVAGVLLGDFTRCEEPNAPRGEPTPADVLRDRLGSLDVPVLGGFPSGHGDECFPLLHGARVTLDADAGLVSFDEGLGAR